MISTRRPCGRCILMQMYIVSYDIHQAPLRQMYIDADVYCVILMQMYIVSYDIHQAPLRQMYIVSYCIYLSDYIFFIRIRTLRQMANEISTRNFNTKFQHEISTRTFHTNFPHELSTRNTLRPMASVYSTRYTVGGCESVRSVWVLQLEE